MKSSGFKSRGGGLKRKAPSDIPEGISRNRLGELRVKDAGYMKHLHDIGTKPLSLGSGLKATGVMELHHTKTPVNHSKRRDFDSTVVPLDHIDHHMLERGVLDECDYHRMFAVWSAWSYWSYRSGGHAAEAFASWVNEKLEEENVMV